MSEFDAVVAQILKGTVLSVIVGLMILMLFLKNFRALYQKYFVWIFTLFSRSYQEVLFEYKEVLFAPLQNFKSLDWNLRNQGLVRILEIGVGSGTNFKFYPKNARVIAVDANPYFSKELEKHKAEYPHVKLEKFIVSKGEHLHELADDSVDIVVTTAVLCSVNNMEVLLREIQRVLAPGGVYFFMEHVVWPEGSTTWRRVTQRLLNIVWPLVFGGCQTTRDMESVIRAAGFENVQFNRFVISKYFKIFLPSIGAHIHGTAQKKKAA